jgi:cytochrome c
VAGNVSGRACFGGALAFVTLGMSLWLPLQAQGDPTRPVTTVWSGVYTDAQAERGSVIYLQTCAGCHGSDLHGDSIAEYPALAGDDFMWQWQDAPVAKVVERIQTRMPFDRPGTLSLSDTVNLMAFLLRANDIPAGTTELPPDAQLLQRIALTPGPATPGPARHN